MLRNSAALVRPFHLSGSLKRVGGCAEARRAERSGPLLGCLGSVVGGRVSERKGCRRQHDHVWKRKAGDGKAEI